MTKLGTRTACKIIDYPDHVEVELRSGHKIVIDPEDRRFVEHGYIRCIHGYATVKRHGKTELLHRLILGAPAGTHVDHRDLDTLNDRRSNLRVANHPENAANTGPHNDNTSGFKGVHWSDSHRKWQARIMAHGVRHYLGGFDTAAAAALAYDTKAAELHGEFARLNFPTPDIQSQAQQRSSK